MNYLLYAAFLGYTLDVIGKILIAFTVVAVHERVRKEHKIDARVFQAMKRERKVAIWGIFLMAIGYVLQVPAKLGYPI
jgi:hypothetical protein